MKKKATVHFISIARAQRAACGVIYAVGVVDRRKVTCDRCARTKAYDEAGKRKKR